MPLTKATSLADFSDFLHKTYAIEGNTFTVEQTARDLHNKHSTGTYVTYLPTACLRARAQNPTYLPRPPAGATE